MLDFINILLKTLLIALIASTALSLHKIEKHQAFVEEYLRDSTTTLKVINE